MKNEKQTSECFDLENIVKVTLEHSSATRDVVFMVLLDASANNKCTSKEMALIRSLKEQTNNITLAPHPTHMPPCHGYDKGIALLDFLKAHDFIDIAADPRSFLYCMGCTAEIPENIKLIRWKKSKQLLREMLSLFFDKELANGSYKKVDIEEMVPMCFVDKNGNKMILPNNKPVLTADSDLLTAFFAKY